MLSQSGGDYEIEKRYNLRLVRCFYWGVKNYVVNVYGVFRLIDVFSDPLDQKLLSSKKRSIDFILREVKSSYTPLSFDRGMKARLFFHKHFHP